MHKDKPITGYTENKTILEKNMRTERIWQKSQVDKEHKKDLQRLEESTVAKSILDWLWEILKKEKTTAYDDIHGLWFTKSTFFNDRLALQLSKYLKDESMDDERENDRDAEGPSKRNNPQQL